MVRKVVSSTRKRLGRCGNCIADAQVFLKNAYSNIVQYTKRYVRNLFLIKNKTQEKKAKKEVHGVQQSPL